MLNHQQKVTTLQPRLRPGGAAKIEHAVPFEVVSVITPECLPRGSRRLRA
ncbi:hypothetical protein FOTG_19257 [Fusarium oxysporum f. sp. vasinfectum 25433]|uniref:Uncharacterized protein n=1 Tax=Fusarium oxysporum f. sp. vasinfectum 25433 TaxID=1089449 RepID=X0KTX5_FUSOX|nr:hypothetical protein FOTG_19257 [Fusarium oxysporum f. sp. vasinfectum 25433]